MRNGPRRGRHSPQSRRRPSPGAEPKQWTRSEPNRSRNAQRNYEHYIALARAAALNGNEIEAENYYQHAEHYYRSMSADSQEV
jgi:Domain of unknown function (DUF4167)